MNVRLQIEAVLFTAEHAVSLEDLHLTFESNEQELSLKEIEVADFFLTLITPLHILPVYMQRGIRYEGQNLYLLQGKICIVLSLKKR